MNISLRLLRYVVAAADCGNVTEAARRLQVSQPSVSAAIAELEQMLSITIFVRHHAKGVTLTPAGQRLIGEARLLLKHAEEFSKTAEALGDTVRGEITVGCFPTLAARYLPSLMLAFSRRYPLISLKLEEGNQEQLFRDLSQGRIEMAICYDFGVPSSFDSRSLWSLPPMVALSANHRLARATDVSLSELLDEPFILYDAPHTRDYCLNLFTSQGLQPTIGLRLHSFELIRGLIGRGHGYSIECVLPLTPTTYDGGHVITKPIRDPVPAANVICATPGSHLIRPAVGIFSDFLHSAVARGEHQNDDTPPAASAA